MLKLRLRRLSKLEVFLICMVGVFILGASLYFAYNMGTKSNESINTDKRATKVQNTNKTSSAAQTNPAATNQNSNLSNQNKAVNPSNNSSANKIDCGALEARLSAYLQPWADSAYQSYLQTKTAMLTPPPADITTVDPYIDKAYATYINSLDSNYLSYTNAMSKDGCIPAHSRIAPQPR